MKLKKLITISLFLAIGFILHQIMPPIFLGIKPDFLLSMMFISIIVCDDYKSALLCGIVFGIFAAITTGFPGGQIPNVIDKIVTANFIYLLNKYAIKPLNKINSNIKIVSLSFLGTLVSGAVFLFSVSLMFGLPANFIILFLTVVLPTSLLNCFITMIIYNLFLGSKKIILP